MRRGKAADFGGFLYLRCLFRFLPALKASDFAGFPDFRCLFANFWPRKATYSGGFLCFRCLFRFLPALKASDFAGFPVLRCLFASPTPASPTPYSPCLRKISTFPNYSPHQTKMGLPHESLRATAPSAFCYYTQIAFYWAFTLAFLEIPLKILPSPLFLKARTL